MKRNKTVRGYNMLASVYDCLSMLVLGKKIKQAQLQLLHHLKGKKKLLILGGGTGWILPHILKANPCLEIHFVDVSDRMIELAKQHAGTGVWFISGTEKNIPDNNYDALLTHFFLDLFTDKELNNLIAYLKLRLSDKACWLVCDFESGNRSQKILIRLMYLFFRALTGLRTRALPHWYNLLKQAGFNEISTWSSRHGFIRSVVFQVRTN